MVKRIVGSPLDRWKVVQAFNLFSPLRPVLLGLLWLEDEVIAFHTALATPEFKKITGWNILMGPRLR